MYGEQVSLPAPVVYTGCMRTRPDFPNQLSRHLNRSLGQKGFELVSGCAVLLLKTYHSIAHLVKIISAGNILVCSIEYLK